MIPQQPDRPDGPRRPDPFAALPFDPFAPPGHPSAMPGNGLDFAEIAARTVTAALAGMRAVAELDALPPHAPAAQARAVAERLDRVHREIEAAGVADQCMIFWARWAAELSPGGLILRGVPFNDEANDPLAPGDPGWRTRLSRMAAACSAEGGARLVCDMLRTWDQYGDHHDRQDTRRYSAGTASVAYSLAITTMNLARQRLGDRWAHLLLDDPDLRGVYLGGHVAVLAWLAELADKAAVRLELHRDAGYTAPAADDGRGPRADAVSLLLGLLDVRMGGDESAGYSPQPMNAQVVRLGGVLLGALLPDLADGAALTFSASRAEGGGLVRWVAGEELPRDPRRRGAARLALVAAAYAGDDQAAADEAVAAIAEAGREPMAMAATAAVDWLALVLDEQEAAALAM